MNKDLFDENDDKYINDFYKDNENIEFNKGYNLGKKAIKNTDNNSIIQSYKEWINAYDTILEYLKNYDITSAVICINSMKEIFEQELNKITYKPKVEDITKEDKLEVLDFLIHLSLKENSKKLFHRYGKEYDELLNK